MSAQDQKRPSTAASTISDLHGAGPTTGRVKRVPPPEGELLAEKFRLKRILGAGGYGTVFEAINVLTQKSVAIKWLGYAPTSAAAPRWHASALREAQAPPDHANLAEVTDFGEDKKWGVFLVMKLLRGQSLQERLKQCGGRMSARETLAVLRPALRGLGALHQHPPAGVVHRDLKPAHVFLCEGYENAPESSVKLIDFGLAKLVKTLDISTDSLTATGEVLGTPGYLSPEQLTNRELTTASDIFPMGIILYQALAGKHPFPSTTSGEYGMAIAKGARPLEQCIADLPPGLSAVVMRALETDPAARYPDAQALLNALEKIDTLSGSGSGSSRRIHRKSGLAVAAIVTLAGSMSWWALSPDPAAMAPETPSTAGPRPSSSGVLASNAPRPESPKNEQLDEVLPAETTPHDKPLAPSLDPARLSTEENLAQKPKPRARAPMNRHAPTDLRPQNPAIKEWAEPNNTSTPKNEQSAEGPGERIANPSTTGEEYLLTEEEILNVEETPSNGATLLTEEEILNYGRKRKSRAHP